MEQFSLEKWLRNKSRKICTRDGRPVRIVCWDRQSSDDYRCIVGLVDNGVREDTMYFDKSGHYSTYSEGFCDLLFADEEERLTEFEEQLASILFDREYEGKTNTEDDIERSMLPYRLAAKEYSRELLDLARNEILTDLPKWKKVTEYKELDKHVAIIDYNNKVALTNVLDVNDYYIELEDLLKLSKEE